VLESTDAADVVAYALFFAQALQAMADKRDEKTTGREAPMVIWPRDIVRLGRQLREAARSAARRATKRTGGKANS
jgi:hypothetical protein